MTEVLIVGGGAAGLASAATLAKRGIPSLVLERAAVPGVSWLNRYDRLRLHTWRALSGLPYRRLPRRLGKYVATRDYARYLDDYAHELKLEVRTGCNVTAVRPAGGRWQVVTDDGDFEARAVVIATGLYREPVVPTLPGAARFGGRRVSVTDYRSGSEFAGQRVLVVGLGNTGAELAADLVEQGAAAVAVSVRSVPPITPRDVLGGVPSQLVGLGLGRLPTRAADAITTGFRKLGPDLSPWKLDRPDWNAFGDHRPPVIDVGFLQHLTAGSINVHPALATFTTTGAEFVDGSTLDVDVVVLATGYTTGLPKLLAAAPNALDEQGMPTSSSPLPGLHFLGFTPTLRGQLLEIRKGARRQASRIARELEN